MSMDPRAEIRRRVTRAAANHDVDALTSMEHEIAPGASYDNDALICWIRSEISRVNDDLDHALDLVRQEREIYAKASDALGVAMAEYDIGMLGRRTGQYHLALEHLTNAAVLFEEANDLLGAALATSDIGNTHYAHAEYDKSTEFLQRAYEMYERAGDRHAAAIVLGNMSLTLATIGDFAEALRVSHRVLAAYAELDDEEGEAYMHRNIGSIFRNTGDYSTALEHYHKALDIHQRRGHQTGIASLHGGIGNVLADAGDDTAALEYLHRSLHLYEDLNNHEGVARTCSNIGTVYMDLEDFEQALVYHLRSIDIHTQIDHVHGIVTDVSNLAMTYIALHRPDDAREILRRPEIRDLQNPIVELVIEGARAQLAELEGDLVTAIALQQDALVKADERSLKHQSAKIHGHLKSIAQRQGDFAAYIKHNDAQQLITEEIRGAEAQRRLAVQESRQAIEAERQQHEKHKALLFNTLPQPIAERVLRGETVNDSIDHAAVMFMDMVGFTSMSSSMTPDDVVALLGDIFSACDRIIAEHGLMKIKTIGDSYMSVAFPDADTQPDAGAQHAAPLRAAMAALSTLRMMTDRFPQIRVRIGIHCGPVTAGVIGSERLQYDVWGDTVNVASRMESTSEPGRVQVSEALANALRGIRSDCSPGITVMYRGEIDVKGKGPMTTFWLVSADT